MRNVRNAAGSTGYGELEIADDPLDAGRKCFRLSYPTTLQGLVLPLTATDRACFAVQESESDVQVAPLSVER